MIKVRWDVILHYYLLKVYHSSCPARSHLELLDRWTHTVPTLTRVWWGTTTRIEFPSFSTWTNQPPNPMIWIGPNAPSLPSMMDMEGLCVLNFSKIIYTIMYNILLWYLKDHKGWVLSVKSQDGHKERFWTSRTGFCIIGRQWTNHRKIGIMCSLCSHYRFIVLLSIDSTCYVANVGDSRAIISQD